jgi:hypothetical protein
LDDVWRFSMKSLEYCQIRTIGVDAPLLARSNHTAVYDDRTNAVFVFGGGQAHKLRFNDTLKLTFSSWQSTSSEVYVERLRLKDDSPLPQPRTYHAACLVGQFMVVVGGESNNTDMQDVWVLDLKEGRWF